MSKLIVKVVRINKIYNHPNADRLSIIEMDGNSWSCIVGRNQYKLGSLVVFTPPDSVIPENLIEEYKLEFLKKCGRVGTVKLRKCISQGLILNIPEGKKWKEGKEVSKELGITKYEPPVKRTSLNSGKQPTKKKRNPLFDKYTDIENIKNYNTVFKDGESVVITEKIHGTNFRAGNLPRYRDNLWGKLLAFLFGKYEFVYGSHRVQKTPMNRKMGFYGEDVYGRIAKKYKLKEIIPPNYILYGEIYGAGIQELEYGMNDIDVAFFDVKYKDKYLDSIDYAKFCGERNLPMVPLLYIGEYREEDLIKYTQRSSILAFRLCKEDNIAEGCVVKSEKEEYTHTVGRKILKSINPEYLARKNRTEYH